MGQAMKGRGTGPQRVGQTRGAVTTVTGSSFRDKKGHGVRSPGLLTGVLNPQIQHLHVTTQPCPRQEVEFRGTLARMFPAALTFRGKVSWSVHAARAHQLQHPFTVSM